MTTPLGTLLSEARARKGLSQSALAQIIGTTRQYVQGIEQGHKVLSHPDTIDAIGTALDLDTDTIYATLGNIPPDIEQVLTSGVRMNFDTVRAALGMDYDTGTGTSAWHKLLRDEGETR